MTSNEGSRFRKNTYRRFKKDNSFYFTTRCRNAEKEDVFFFLCFMIFAPKDLNAAVVEAIRTKEIRLFKEIFTLAKYPSHKIETATGLKKSKLSYIIQNPEQIRLTDIMRIAAHFNVHYLYC